MEIPNSRMRMRNNPLSDLQSDSFKWVDSLFQQVDQMIRIFNNDLFVYFFCAKTVINKRLKQ